MMALRVKRQTVELNQNICKGSRTMGSLSRNIFKYSLTIPSVKLDEAC
jgi:hypothetical protein